MQIDSILLVKDKIEKQLFLNPDVVMVDIGRKKISNQYTHELCISVFVSKKKPLLEVMPERLIPSMISGIKTDVLEGVSAVNASIHRAGIYIESDYNKANGAALGFFGFLSDDLINPTPVLVTNQHVLMNGKDVTSQGAEVGPTVCSWCSPCCSKVVANVAFAVLDESVDIAAAVLQDNVKFVPEIKGIGVIKGIHTITSAEALSHTYEVKIYSLSRERVITGKVFGINTAGDAFLDDEKTVFHRHYTNQIRIVGDDPTLEPWVQHGDSGSAVVNNDNEIVGVIFANGKDENGQLGLACPILAVENALHVFPAIGTAPNQVHTVKKRITIPSKGDPLDMHEVLTGGLFVSPVTEKIKIYYSRVSATKLGAEYEELFKKYTDEVRKLVNTNKRVATVWHKNNGPEWLIHVSRSIENDDYTLNAIKGKDIQSLLLNMASILKQYGSHSLITDIDKHLESLVTFSKHNTIAQLMSELERQEANNTNLTS